MSSDSLGYLLKVKLAVLSYGVETALGLGWWGCDCGFYSFGEDRSLASKPFSAPPEGLVFTGPSEARGQLSQHHNESLASTSA